MTAPLVVDALLKQTAALPDGAASTSTAAIDLEKTSRGDFTGHIKAPDLIIEAPVLNTTQQPNAKTLIYKVEQDTDPAFGTVETLYAAVITQTGAGGTGAAAASKRVALPVDVKRYVRVTATGSASGNASAASMVAYLAF